jgi:lipopolysaccharide transport system permease protein
VIEPRVAAPAARLRELWEYRRLLRFFARRALEKQYVRTRFGIAWLGLRPILDTTSRVLVFGSLLNAPAPKHVPYLLFFMVGMAVWTLFERCLLWATRSIELNRKLVTRIYFPRILLPFAVSFAGIVDFLLYVFLAAIAFAAFVAFDGALYLETSARLLLGLGGIGLALLFAWGLGLWTSVLGAATRDLRFSLSYLTGFWFLMTPVIYPLDAVPEQFRSIAAVNPLAPIVELVRWGTIDAGELNGPALGLSAVTIAVVWMTGLWYFGKAEAASVDRL